MRASELHRLARILREIALASTANTGADGVTPGQLAIVEDVAAHPSTTVGQVAARTRLAQSLVSRVTAEMRAAGVFEVDRDPTDARRTVISVAPEARTRMRSRAAVSIDGALTDALPAASPEDRAALTAHLGAALAILEGGPVRPE